VLGVVVGAEKGLSIVDAFDCSEGVVAVALRNLCGDDLDLILVLILNCNGDVVHKVMPIGLNVVLKHLVVDIDVGVGGGLGDIAGKSVGDVLKWNDGEGIGVMDRTLYDLCVCEETS
jgi:hypothetical protein